MTPVVLPPMQWVALKERSLCYFSTLGTCAKLRGIQSVYRYLYVACPNAAALGTLPAAAASSGFCLSVRRLCCCRRAVATHLSTAGPVRSALLVRAASPSPHPVCRAGRPLRPYETAAPAPGKLTVAAAASPPSSDRAEGFRLVYECCAATRLAGSAGAS